MITVVIVNDGNHDKLDLTLASLDRQTYKDFDILIMDPHNEVDGVMCPAEINNQINTAVVTRTSEYYAVTCSGCVVHCDWLLNLSTCCSAPYICGSVYLSSVNTQPYWIYKPASYKYGECDSLSTANYNNLAFSLNTFKLSGGFNAKHDTQSLFVNSFDGFFDEHNYVEKVLDFDTSRMNDVYRFLTTQAPKMVEWTPVCDSIVPTKPNLLITIAIGAQCKEEMLCTETQMYKYAEILNADCIQLTNKTQEWWGLEKFRIKEIAKHYERVLFVDSDIWINNNIPNIFDVVPKGCVGITNDFKNNYSGTEISNVGLIQEAKEMCFYQQTKYAGCELFNSGVVVFDGDCADIWTPPPHPFRPKHCAEQHWLEQNIKNKKYPVHTLDQLWNNQWWTKNYVKLEDESHFLHMSGSDGKTELLYRLLQKDFVTKDQDLITIKYKNINYIKNNNLCIVTVCSDNFKLLELTKKTHQRYADKIGADYHIITDNPNPHWSMGNKYLIYNFTKRYDKTLYVDSDVYIKKKSPNIFNITPDDVISIHNESYELLSIAYNKYVQAMYENVCNKLKHPIGQAQSLNCGVMVIPKNAADVYVMPQGEFPAYWCFDQHFLWLTLQINNLNYCEIGPLFNWEYINMEWEKGINDAFFIHLNGIKYEPKRIRLIKEIMKNDK